MNMNTSFRFNSGPSVDALPRSGQLWNYFSQAYQFATKQAPESFQFEDGKVPMSTQTEVIVALITYYTIIFGGRELMRNRPRFELNGIFKVHNFFLTALSGILLVLHLEQILPTLFGSGVLHSVCRRAGGWTPPLEVLYYLNYLTKYVELLDTVFLVLKKKPLTFLHTYHHGATALLCYTQLAGRTPVSWVPITLNLMVHVVMYWYYFQAARGIKIWWKKYITVLQIVQFVIDLGFIYFCFYTELSSTTYKFLGLPNWGRCEGEHWAAWCGVFILTSYLFLFIGFYMATYKKMPAGAKEKTGTAALIELKTSTVPDAVEIKEKVKDELVYVSEKSR